MQEINRKGPRANPEAFVALRSLALVDLHGSLSESRLEACRFLCQTQPLGCEHVEDIKRFDLRHLLQVGALNIRQGVIGQVTFDR